MIFFLAIHHWGMVGRRYTIYINYIVALIQAWYSKDSLVLRTDNFRNVGWIVDTFIKALALINIDVTTIIVSDTIYWFLHSKYRYV